MFIRQKEYERLVNSDKIRKNLEQEVKRLAELISAKVTDCKVGPWCKDCQHIGTDDADLIGERLFESGIEWFDAKFNPVDPPQWDRSN